MLCVPSSATLASASNNPHRTLSPPPCQVFPNEVPGQSVPIKNMVTMLSLSLKKYNQTACLCGCVVLDASRRYW